jgi:hypothetical protein
MKKKEKQAALALAVIVIVIVAIAAYEVISAKPSTLHIDMVLTNSGSQDTTEFTINNTWAVAWKINNQSDNLFLLSVFYLRNVTIFSEVANAAETDTNLTQGVLPVPYTGSFIIRVIASNDTQWTLVIEELMPT